MRPLEVPKETESVVTTKGRLTRVLFIAEHGVEPIEVMPYLRELIDRQDIKLTIKFRPYRDGFESWLLQNEPQILKLQHVQIVKGGMQEAIQDVDVVVGFRSTAVLEALLQLKIPVFLHSQKWGDYYNMTETKEGWHFFAENPKELIERVKHAHNIQKDTLMKLREQYFGDPHKNGSAWVVDKLEQMVSVGKVC